MQHLLKGRRLFQWGYPKLRRLLEGDVYKDTALIRRNTVVSRLFVTACFWEEDSSRDMKVLFIESDNELLISSQKNSKKSFLALSFPGDLSFFIDFKALSRSV